MPPKKDAAPAAAAAPEGPPPVYDMGPDISLTKKKLREAWAVFDVENTGVIDAKHVPTILRALKLFVTDKDFTEMILPAMQGTGGDPSPHVPYAGFEDKVLKMLSAHESMPDGGELLLAAFRALDKEGSGRLEVDRLRRFLTGQGSQPLTDEEFARFIATLQPDAEGKVAYLDYVSMAAAGWRSGR